MRWQALFDDLEGQLAAAEARDLDGEVADRTRREVGAVRLADRLRAHAGSELAVTVEGVGTVRGALLDVGPDWLLLADGVAEVLVAASAVLAVVGLGAAADPAAQEGPGAQVARHLDLRWALRGLARDRVTVRLVLRDGSARTGTLDRVGADAVDLAEHLPGEARRSAAVRQVSVLPITAVVLVRSA